MPKRIGHLYEKMLDRNLIRKVIIEGSKGKRKRHDVKKVLSDVEKYTDKVYEILKCGSYDPTDPRHITILDTCSVKKRTIGVVPYYPDGIVHRLIVEVAAGDTVTVYCEFDQLAVYNYYGTVTFSSTGAFTVSANVQNADTRDTNSLVEGTGTAGGYGYPCEMKTYINETVYPLIPATVRSNIKAVKKYTRIYNAQNQDVNNVVTSELAWIPSYREIFGGTNYESQGPVYTVVYPDAASRIKKKAGATSASPWWLRSANGTGNFISVNASGNVSISNASGSYGVALGFST